jgi:antitoxin (DNA-binding transcriptional repressor) of toxin-antitoxin stability system
MPTVTIEEAQHRLTELIHGLACGEDLVITEHDQPIARLSLTAPPPQKPRTPGHSGALSCTWPLISTRRLTTSRNTAQAQAEAAPLVSVDSILDLYGINRIW